MNIYAGTSHIAMTAAEQAAGRYMRGPDHPGGDGSGTDGGAGAAEPDAFSTAFDDLTAPPAKDDAAAGAAGSGGAGDGTGSEAGAGAGTAGGDGTGADAGTAGGAADSEKGTGTEGGDGGAAGASGAAAAKPEGGSGAAAAGAETPGGTGGAGGDGAAKPADADAILKGLEALIDKKVAEPKAGEGAAAEQPQTEEVPPLYTDEEQALLDSYEKEWPDVVKGEALKRKAEYRELVGYIFNEVAKFVAPIKETAEQLAVRTHLAELGEAVPDYSDNLRDEVTEWVKTQPAYLQTAYNQVITTGTPDEVKDLVGRYRTATGKTATPGAGAPAQDDPKLKGKDNELSEPAKKAAEALAPVESKRSGVQQPADLSNYDDAWAVAAKELG